MSKPKLPFVGDVQAASARLDLCSIEKELVPAVAAARTGDAAALKKVHSILDAGLFDTDLSTLSCLYQGVPTLGQVNASQGPLFDAFLGAYAEARFTQVFGEPGSPTFPVPIFCALPHGVPAFESVLSKVFEALVEMDETMQARCMDSNDQWRTQTFAKALATACTMGMASAIGPLAARRPDALREPLSLGNFMSSSWRQHMANISTHLVTPVFFAVQYGHPECIDALRAAGLERQFCLTHFGLPGEQGVKSHPHHEFFSSFSLSILPSQLPAMLDRMDHKVSSKNPGMNAIESTHPFVPDSLKTQRTFLPVFMAAGTFDKIPVNEVLHAACVHNVSEAIDFFVDQAPWSVMNSTLITDVAKKKVDALGDDALVSLLKIAQELGHHHLFSDYESARQDPKNPTHFPASHDSSMVSVTEPAYSVVKAGMRETLVLLMQNGLKPDEKDGFNTSPLDVAHDLNKPEMEHVMKTFMARRTVLGILDEMDTAQSIPSSPPA